MGAPRWCVLPLLIVSFSGCGSDGASSARSPDAASSARSPDAASSARSADGANGLPCSETVPSLLAKEVPDLGNIAVYCDFQGSRVVVQAFENSAELEEQLSKYDGPSVRSVSGTRWLASEAVDGPGLGWACDEEDLVAAFAAEFQGEPRSFGC